MSVALIGVKNSLESGKHEHVMTQSYLALVNSFHQALAFVKTGKNIWK